MDTLTSISLFVLWTGVAALSLAGLYRLFAGPSPLDRLLGLDAVALGFVGVLGADALGQGSVENLDFALVFTAVGFLGTTLVVTYLFHNPRPQEEPS
jgi:multicomponent Na+:H+ antiporter subunit F